MSESPRESLILWDLEFVGDWIVRNETYVRLRTRANAGNPALSVQAFAEFLRVLRMRRLSEAQIGSYVLELREQFTIIDLTPERAEAYALAALDCIRLAQDPVQAQTWFAWQVALSRHEGHRVMTKAPQRYRGLVPVADLA